MEDRIKFIKIWWERIYNTDNYILRIIDQSHRRKHFGVKKVNGESTAVFYGSDKTLRLESSNHPEWRESEKIFYVRGEKDYEDSKFMKIDSVNLIKIIDVINQYNKYFGSSDIEYIFADTTVIKPMIDIKIPKELFVI